MAVQGKIEYRVSMYGLDDAGKTSILYKLKLDEFNKTTPTEGFNVESVEHRNFPTPLTVWDIGGQEKTKKIWDKFCGYNSAVIFVVDASNPSRIEEAAKELFRVLEWKEIEGVPVLIFANKNDLPNAMDYSSIENGLQLQNIKNRKWKLQLCSAATGSGLFDGMDWICKQLPKVKTRSWFTKIL